MEVVRIKTGQYLLAGSPIVDDLGGDGIGSGGGGTGSGSSEPQSPEFDEFMNVLFGN